MAIDVRMPKLSDNMEEGIIIRWMKAPGDQVAKGEPLAEVETDKADVELEASESGVLREIKIQEGESAAVGAVIAVLAAADEAGAEAGGDSTRRATKTARPADGPTDGDAGPPAARPATPVVDDTDGGGARRGPAPARGPGPRQAAGASARPMQRPAGAAARGVEPKGASNPDDPSAEHAVRASPLAWRLADEAGVNLSGVRGSGPGGRILKRDVEASVGVPAPPAAASEPAPAPGAAQDGAPAAVTPADSAGGRLVEATRMRLAIAKRMSEAKRDIPHFYVGAEIDMGEAMRLRASIKRREAIQGLTVTHLLLRALAIALVRHPRVNAAWRDTGIELHEDVNIGIAVAVEDGLVVPVLRRAQLLTLSEIVSRAAVLTEKARSGKFGGDELTGGTFSLSNVGMLDVDELVAVINPPQAAILAVAAVKDRPIVRDGQLAVGMTMRATLSCDHRVLNGVEGGRFLAELKDILENPMTLLLE